MPHPYPVTQRINHRLTATGLSDRFELRLRNGDWEYCVWLDADSVTALRDQLAEWIDNRTEAHARSVSDSPLPPPSDSVIRKDDPAVYQRDATWGGGK